MKIAILGAERTGKSVLAAALDAYFRTCGIPVHGVSDYGREWYEIHQRIPRQDELHPIAQTQMVRIAATPAAHILIADTTALVTAVYSQRLFNDHSLDSLTLDHQSTFDITLLMGLDVDGQHDGFQGHDAHVRETFDQQIRQLLTQGRLPFQVVYGTDQQRLENALFCIGKRAPEWARKLERQEKAARWNGPCENCGDGACEHRLFTDLLKP